MSRLAQVLSACDWSLPNHLCTSICKLTLPSDTGKQVFFFFFLNQKLRSWKKNKAEEFGGCTTINICFLKDKYPQSKVPQLSNAKTNVCAPKYLLLIIERVSQKKLNNSSSLFVNEPQFHWKKHAFYQSFYTFKSWLRKQLIHWWKKKTH